jgi:hypothetical protein
MPWARFEDDYLGNQKLATLSTAAIALDMAAIIYSARELRDGVLSAADVQTVAALIHLKRWPPAAAELVRVNRWTSGKGVYTIHDYLEYQPSREQILKQREEDRERKRRGARVTNATRNSSGGREDSGRTPDAPVPGPGPGPVPGIPTELESFPTPNPSPQAERGAPPDGANGSLTNGSTTVTTACCLIAELSDGREHSNSCSVAV